MGRIVVGIDGSEESKAALRWAIEEARLRRASVRVVCAWPLPYIEGPGLAIAGPGLAPVGLYVQTLQRDAEGLLETVLAEVGATGIDVERAAVGGVPAQVLVEAAQNADLLVVGSRGRGGFAGLVLGSVSRQCAHHASCPVVIVREEGKR